ncbi:MAG TPA: signal peptidase I [Anaerolineae bacterium]|nr:signal peptidase I [Anaerolineae bacterium]
MNIYRSEMFPDEIEEEQGGESPHQVLKDISQTIVLSLIIFFIINFLSARIRVESVSMRETLKPDDFVVVSRVVYKFKGVDRGDIIVFNPPFYSPEPYIKRVIGLPGDDIRIQDGNVFINGERIKEPYIRNTGGKSGKWKVPEGNLFVMGDNRGNSSDSRAWGMVPFENVIGKAIFVYWPPREWGALTIKAIAAEYP